MGSGREIGEQIDRWRRNGDLKDLRGQALANRLMDAAGSNQRLHAPLRDLSQQPLFLQILNASQPTNTQASLQSLTAELQAVYSPAIVGELIALLEAGAGVTAPGGSQPPRGEPPADSAPNPSTLPSSRRGRSSRWESLGEAVLPLSPGLAVGGGGVLAAAWLGAELDRLLFQHWSWSSDTALVLLLAMVHLASLTPGSSWRQRGLLDDNSAADPRQAWLWVSAPWLHEQHREVIINGLMLLILLGQSAVPLQNVALGYTLTDVVCLKLALLMARRHAIQRSLGGSSGAVAALVSLATTLSLLDWKAQSFALGPVQLPAWLLLWAYATLQLSWILPRRDRSESHSTWQQILSSLWFWGTVFGCLAGMVGWLTGIERVI